jgi:hypothetical protein
VRRSPIRAGSGYFLRPATGDESFVPFGSEEAEHPEPGEIVFAEGATVLTRSSCLLEKVFGEDHHQVANTLYELGSLYAVQGRHRDAEPLFERSLAIREARLGESHPYVAETLQGLAELHRDQDRTREAEVHYRRALSILENAVNPDHPLLVRLRESYAAFLRAQGRQELFALSGMMLKIWIMSEIEMVSGRPVARRESPTSSRAPGPSPCSRIRPPRPAAPAHLASPR